MKIIDASGVWLINRGQFRLVDGETGTFFEPKEPTKATYTTWVKGQINIELTIDPTLPIEEVSIVTPEEPSQVTTKIKK